MLPTTSQSGECKTLATQQEAWGTEGTSSKDLVVPNIQVAQANSNSCKEGNARPGDLIHSLTKEVLASKGQKLSLLPILCVGAWVVTTPKPAGGGFPAFIRKYELIQENDSDNWKIEEFENGVPVVHNKSLTFLVLLVDRLKAFPFYLNFQGTNKNGGKLLSTVMQENKFQGLPAPSRVVDLSTSLKNYKNNSWFVMSVMPQRQASSDELSICKKWYDLFSQSKLKEAEEESDNGIA